MTESAHWRAFCAHYGRAPAVRASAPGRVNLIGEHTDYNGGFVLPVAIPQRTEVLLSPRDDDRVRVVSANINPPLRRHAEYAVGHECRSGGWIDYVAGVTATLKRERDSIRGFDASLQSGVPIGAGLSSSAALEVAVLRALNDVFALGFDALAIARLAHAAETQFVGVPVGIMDQMASSLARPDEALFIDTASLTYQPIALPESTALVVIDSGITHDHAAGEYRVRRQECQDAARRLGLATLRLASCDDLGRGVLPEPLRSRVRHVLTENDRVLQARQLLLARDAPGLGALMNASHESLRDDFQVSLPDIDRLVRLAQSETGIFGARLTGGGFGGSIVALARRDSAMVAAQRIAAAYNEGGRCRGNVVLP